MAGAVAAAALAGLPGAAQARPAPTGSASDTYIKNVSCVSTRFCIAVGYYWNNTGAGQATLIEKWDGRKWSRLVSADPSSTGSAFLYGVSCVSTKRCTAVGYYNGPSSDDRTLVEATTNGGRTWTIATSANPGTGELRDQFSAVTCTSSTDCTAVGSYETATNVWMPLIEYWSGSDWTAVPVADLTGLPSGNETYYANGVSCSSGTSCTVVGYYSGTNTNWVDRTLIVTGHGSSWTVQSSPSASTDGGSDLYDVSCLSGGSCTAAGYYWGSETGGPDRTLVLSGSGSSWSISTTPNTTGADAQDLLLGVSCLSSSFCKAVGTYNGADTEYVFQTLALGLGGSGWAVQTSPNVAPQSGHQYNELRSVSCVSTSFCVAGGYFVDTSITGTPDQPLFEEWDGTSWALIASPAILS